MKNDRGSAYVLVIVVTMSMFIALAIVDNLSSYEMQVSRAYKNHSNLSALAQSGIGMGEQAVNNRLNEKRGQVSDKALEALAAYDIMTKVRFENGNYRLQNNLYGEIFAKEAQKILAPMFDGQIMRYSMEADGLYDVAVSFSATTDGFELVSVAKRSSSGTQETVKAKLICGSLGHDEIVQGDFKWRAVPAWASAAITTNASLAVTADAFSDEISWSTENPIFFTKNSTALDVSQYDGDTIFISLSDEILYVTASRPAENNFSGIIFAAGAVEVADGVYITGSIISNDAVTYGGALSAAADMLPSIRFSDKALQKSVFDFFGVSGDVEFAANRAYIINLETDIRYRVQNVKNIR